MVPQDCHLVKKITKVISSQHKHKASVSCEKTCVWMHAIDNYGQGFTLNKSELSDLEPDVILESKTLNFSSDDTLMTEFEYSCFTHDPLWGRYTSTFIFVPGLPLAIMFSYSLRDKPVKGGLISEFFSILKKLCQITILSTIYFLILSLPFLLKVHC